MLATAGALTPVAAPARSVLELFDLQVARTPEAIAVSAAEQTLTYAAFSQAATQVARVLRARGVGPDVRVAVCLERSVDLVVALLGVLKAGGAYVPIDPATPAERLAWLIADTGAPVLVTHAAVRARVAGAGVPVVELPLAAAAPSLWPGITTCRRRRSRRTTWRMSSTRRGRPGRPKGVLVTHANLAHSTSARTTFYPEAVRAFLLLSSVTFDSSVAGLFWTLCSGGTLVVPADAAAADPAALGELIARHRVSHLLAIPLLYRSILDEAPASSLASLQTVIVAGEACPVELVEHHFKTIPQAELVNEYGPTEAAVWSTAYRCIPGAATTVPIGRPIAGTRACVVDTHLNLVPPGVIGELCIGGAGVARGYLNRADLTAERFVADPFGLSPGERMYRTGDLVRCRADGLLEFVGRRDRQVKLRGVRIELGELEHVIARHPRAADVAVTVLGAGDRQHIAAFVVARGTVPPAAAELETFARRLVPGSMVPATFTVRRAAAATFERQDRLRRARGPRDRGSGIGGRGSGIGIGDRGSGIGDRAAAYSDGGVAGADLVRAVEAGASGRATRRSSSWADTRCWPAACWRAPATRSAWTFPCEVSSTRRRSRAWRPRSKRHGRTTRCRPRRRSQPAPRARRGSRSPSLKSGCGFSTA